MVPLCLPCCQALPWNLDSCIGEKQKSAHKSALGTVSPFPPYWVEVTAGMHVFHSSVGSWSLQVGSGYLQLVASRVFVLTIRILANGKCSFMLRSGKFNNTLAEFMLSCENRMNMKRDYDSKDINQWAQAWALYLRLSALPSLSSWVMAMFLYLFYMCWGVGLVVAIVLVFPKPWD